MKLTFKYIFLIVFSISMTPSVLTAQAWTKSQGSGFYKLDYSTIQATDVFSPKGDLIPTRDLGNSIASFYGEYGITNKITAIAYVPFWVGNTAGAYPASGTIPALPSASFSSFGDVDLGFRIALPVKNIAMSVNVLFGLPTGTPTQANGLATGDGEFNQMIKLAVGTGKTRWWTQGAIGYNNRTKGYSSEFRYDLEFGYKFFNDRLLTILKFNGVESLKNGSVAPSQTGLFSNDVVFAGIGPEILYYVNAKKTIGLSARAAGSLWSKNILAAPSFSLGVFAQF
jgi:protein XagA